MNILETRVDRSTAFHQKSRNRYYLKKYLTAQYTGVSRKKPQGWVFFSASLRSAGGKIYIYAPPIETNFNILKQNKKYYLKYRYFFM